METIKEFLSNVCVFLIAIALIAISVICAVCVVHWATTCSQGDQVCVDKKNKEAAADEAIEEACKTPVLVSQVNDLKLYAINLGCNDHPIYFSASGTHTTHVEHHGKHSTVVDDDVSNAK